MTARASCVYEGWVRHRRFTPHAHRFRYEIDLFYLDLDELPALFPGSRLWANEGFAPLSFRRRDHLGDPRVPLRDTVADLVARQAGRRCRGPIRLLTQPRYFGFAFNPVSFFFCFDAAGESVETIVAEVSNTPWGERHCYVLPAPANRRVATVCRYSFAKAFHVSPFMGMDQVYDWRFVAPGRSLVVHMTNLHAAAPCFDATMSLRRRELDDASPARALRRHPFQTATVFAAIYLQALRLWRKRTPFYSHPRHRVAASLPAVAPHPAGSDHER